MRLNQNHMLVHFGWLLITSLTFAHSITKHIDLTDKHILNKTTKQLFSYAKRFQCRLLKPLHSSNKRDVRTEPEARATAKACWLAEDSICTPRGRDGQTFLTAAHTEVMQAHTSGPTENEYGMSCMFSMITPSCNRCLREIFIEKSSKGFTQCAATYKPCVPVDCCLPACFFNDLGHTHRP